jgi:hypothetical protein
MKPHNPSKRVSPFFFHVSQKIRNATALHTKTKWIGLYTITILRQNIHVFKTGAYSTSKAGGLDLKYQLMIFLFEYIFTGIEWIPEVLNSANSRWCCGVAGWTTPDIWRAPERRRVHKLNYNKRFQELE